MSDTKRLRIKIPMEPVPKARARTAISSNGNVYSYTPERTVTAENTIITYLKPYENRAFNEETPIKISLTFYLRKTRARKKTELLPILKKDIDNLSKTVLDGMNGLLFYDDSQITTLIARKRWVSQTDHKMTGYILIDMMEDSERKDRD